MFSSKDKFCVMKLPANTTLMTDAWEYRLVKFCCRDGDVLEADRRSDGMGQKYAWEKLRVYLPSLTGKRFL